MKLTLKLFIFSVLTVIILANQNIKYLGDWDFDYHTRNSEKRWLVYFYADFCGHCRHFQQDVMDKLELDYSNANIGKVNCGEFRSTCLHRFAVDYIPRLYLIENNTLYDFPFSSLSRENVLESLTMALDPTRGRPVPKAESIFTTLNRDFQTTLEKIHSKVDRFLHEKFEGKTEWYNINYTLGILAGLSFIGSILLILIFRMICRCLCGLCCRRKTTPVVTPQQEANIPQAEVSEKKQQ